MTPARIAAWPSWTRLQLEHKPLLDSLASPDPYCDWTFATMWSWDTEEEVALARLDGGIALRLPSYPLGGPEDFSLNGRPSASAVSAFVAEHREVSLIPKPSVNQLALRDCRVMDDRDQYDYVYDVAEGLRMAGGRFKSVREHVNRARRLYPAASSGVRDLSDPVVADELVELFDEWAHDRVNDTVLERRALQRCLEVATATDLLCAAVVDLDGLLAFALLAPQSRDWAVLPFSKTRPNQGHLASLLWLATLEVARAHRFRWINVEQDLGIPGLRQHKMSRRPTSMLEKVRIVSESTT